MGMARVKGIIGIGNNASNKYYNVFIFCRDSFNQNVHVSDKTAYLL